MSRLILFNKPFQVLSQFSKTTPATETPKKTLKDYIDEPDFYPAGRLDYDSEGLLILVNDGRLQAQISHPRYKLGKTYWAQIEGDINPPTLTQLQRGVLLKDGLTLPAKVKRIDEPDIWPRHPPIRERRHIPTSWVSITLFEGRNRQVRRMLAHVGFPVLRLIRVSIGSWHLNDLQPGECQRLIYSAEYR